MTSPDETSLAPISHSLGISLDELIGKVPPEWQPVVRKYGRALLRMSADELWDWVETIIRGDEREAYRRLVQRLDNRQFVEEMQATLNSWQDANAENYRRLQLQRSALQAVLRVMLSTAIVAVGL